MSSEPQWRERTPRSSLILDRGIAIRVAMSVNHQLWTMARSPSFNLIQGHRHEGGIPITY